MVTVSDYRIMPIGWLQFQRGKGGVEMEAADWSEKRDKNEGWWSA